jgi:hypothetical protein
MMIISQCPSLYRTNQYIHQVLDQKNSNILNGNKIALLSMDAIIHKDFSQEEPIVITTQSFEFLLPGKEIDESVCDLCLKW